MATHFPIALLLVAPVFVILSLVSRKHAVVLSMSALILMGLGTTGAVVASFTGEAARDHITQHALADALERHQLLAETTEATFLILTLIYAMVVTALACGRSCLDGWARITFHAAFLMAYAAGCALLIRTGDQGGRLAHEYEIHAPARGMDESSAVEASLHVDRDEEVIVK